MTDASLDVSSELTRKLDVLIACMQYLPSPAGMCHRYDINDMISGKLQLQLVPDEGQSHIMGDIDLKVGTADAAIMSGVHKFSHSVSAAAGPPLEQPNQIGQWWLLW